MIVCQATRGQHLGSNSLMTHNYVRNESGFSADHKPYCSHRKLINTAHIVTKSQIDHCMSLVSVESLHYHSKRWTCTYIAVFFCYWALKASFTTSLHHPATSNIHMHTLQGWGNFSFSILDLRTLWHGVAGDRTTKPSYKLGDDLLYKLSQSHGTFGHLTSTFKAKTEETLSCSVAKIKLVSVDS